MKSTISNLSHTFWHILLSRHLSLVIYDTLLQPCVLLCTLSVLFRNVRYAFTGWRAKPGMSKLHPVWLFNMSCRPNCMVKFNFIIIKTSSSSALLPIFIRGIENSFEIFDYPWNEKCRESTYITGSQPSRHPSLPMSPWTDQQIWLNLKQTLGCWTATHPSPLTIQPSR